MLSKNAFRQSSFYPTDKANMWYSVNPAVTCAILIFNQVAPTFLAPKRLEPKGPRTSVGATKVVEERCITMNTRSESNFVLGL